HLKPIVEVIKKTNMVSQVFFFDNDYYALKEVLMYEPEMMLMPRAYSYQMVDSAINIFHPKVIHIDPSFYSEEVSSLIRSNNSRIWINALGEPDNLIRNGNAEEAMEKLLQFKANIIQTDEPELLIEYLDSKGLRN
ncbi:MAG: hypothetical protein R3182_02060, partial [Draconibacterium sp.]|nr:hypothetical protein [Draconibacterium sp.]